MTEPQENSQDAIALLCQKHTEKYPTSDLAKSAEGIMEGHRTRFVTLYGPEMLRKADGEELINLFLGDASGVVRALQKELEFGELAQGFGNVSGHMTRYKVYRSSEGDFQRKGPNNVPIPCSESEALDISRVLVANILRRVDLAKSLDLDASSYDRWTAFDNDVLHGDQPWFGRTDGDGPVMHLGWAHKYLAMVYPDLFSFHHKQHDLMQHMIRLGVVPEGERYLLDFQWRRMCADNSDLATLYAPFIMSACYAAFGTMTSYWRVGTTEGVTGEKVPRWPAMRNGGFVSTGWCWLGDLGSLLEGLTGDAAKARIKENIHTGQSRPVRTGNISVLCRDEAGRPSGCNERPDDPRGRCRNERLRIHCRRRSTPPPSRRLALRAAKRVMAGLSWVPHDRL